MSGRNIVMLAALVTALSGCWGGSPPPEQVAVAVHAPCSVTIDGELVSFSVLAERAGGWHGDVSPRITLSRESGAEPGCFERVMQVLNDAGATGKLTMPGNDTDGANMTR